VKRALTAWQGWLPDPTIADAILNRLVHSAHRIALKGETMRVHNFASLPSTPWTQMQFRRKLLWYRH